MCVSVHMHVHIYTQHMQTYALERKQEWEKETKDFWRKQKQEFSEKHLAGEGLMLQQNSLYFSFFIKTKCKSELGMTQIKILMQKHVVSQQGLGVQKWTQTQKKQIIQKDLEKITFPRTDTRSCWHHNSDLQYFVYRIRSFKHRGSNVIWLMQLNEQLWSICVAHWMIKWVCKKIIIMWSLLTMPLSEFSSLFLTETK